MNIRDVLKAGAFCLSMVGMFNNINAMNENPSEEEDYPAWPTMAIDGTPEHPEGEHLAHYHETAEGRGFLFHMPKDARELNSLYKLYQLNGARCTVCKGIDDFWKYMLMDTGEEITARCMDGDKYFIDKYMKRLENFIELTAKHKDEAFTAMLYSTGTYTLNNYLWKSVVRVKNIIDSNKGHTLASTNILEIVFRIDRALSKVGRNKKDFARFFHMLYIDTAYRESPEYKNVLDDMYKLFNGDFSFNI